MVCQCPTVPLYTVHPRRLLSSCILVLYTCAPNQDISRYTTALTAQSPFATPAHFSKFFRDRQWQRDRWIDGDTGTHRCPCKKVQTPQERARAVDWLLQLQPVTYHLSDDGPVTACVRGRGQEAQLPPLLRGGGDRLCLQARAAGGSWVSGK